MRTGVLKAGRSLTVTAAAAMTGYGTLKWRTSTIAITLLCLAEAMPCPAASLAECFMTAGQRYQVAPTLLQAMAATESDFDPLTRHVNQDGSVDVGIMQINSVWFPVLRQFGIGPRTLWDPCYNIQVGAWILAGNIRRYGYTWRAVGAYNAGTGADLETERRREAYARRIHRRLACAARRLRCRSGD